MEEENYAQLIDADGDANRPLDHGNQKVGMSKEPSSQSKSIGESSRTPDRKLTTSRIPRPIRDLSRGSNQPTGGNGYFSMHVTERPHPTYLQAAREVDISGGNFVTANGNYVVAHNYYADIRLLQNAPGNANNNQIGAGVQPRDHISSQRQCDIYNRHLANKGHGFPIWIPEPNNNLPVKYRLKGIGIGDVGIITKTGHFDFLFNICVSSDDSINRDGVPEGFSPCPPIRPSDIDRYTEFGSGSCLMSNFVSNSRNGATLIFELPGLEGAVLTMPDGAETLELRNFRRLKQYMSQNIESWYRYVIGERGREVGNGDVLLVTGRDNSRTWGMATFEKQILHSDALQLKFKPMEEDSDEDGLGQRYHWEYSGVAFVQAGPSRAQVEELRTSNRDQENTAIVNQTLFIRSLNAKMDERIWQDIIEGIGHEIAVDDSKSNSSAHFTATSLQKLIITNSSSEKIAHPSNEINTLALQNLPEGFDNVTMIITHDSDWMSVITKDDITLPPAEELFKRIMQAKKLQNNEGVVSFEERVSVTSGHSEVVSPNIQREVEVPVKMDYIRPEKTSDRSPRGKNSTSSNLTRFITSVIPSASAVASVIPLASAGSQTWDLPLRQVSGNKRTWELLAPPPRLFALLIGINTYKHGTEEKFPTLLGAESDALIFQEYLTQYLRVPISQIRLVLNENATHQHIIESLKLLAKNDQIRKGDPILIFYAGYGAEVSAGKIFRGAKDPHKMIQMLIPYDFSTERGREVRGILDLVIGALIDEIEAEKGDNITVILDCSYTASGTEILNMSDVRVRSVKLRQAAVNSALYSKDFKALDIDDAMTRSTRPFYRHKDRGLKSYMLLAACGSSEEAKEKGGYGIFSSALVRLLRSISPDKLKYCDVLHQMDAIFGQNPQCEGDNRHRLLFNAKVLPPFEECYKIEFRRAGSNSIDLVLDAGAAHGITQGSEFAIFAQSDISRNNAIGIVTVDAVKALSSTMIHRPELGLRVPCVAIQTRAGKKEDLRLLVAPNDRFREIYVRVLDSHFASQYQLHNITLVRDAASGSPHLRASMWNAKEVTFEIMDERVTQYGVSKKFQSVNVEDLGHVAWVLNRIAHYYRELNRTNSDPEITGQIQVEFYKLDYTKTRDWRKFTRQGPNLCHNSHVDFVVDEEAPYGIKIINNSLRDLYPNIFYFDNDDLSIVSYYQCPLSASPYSNDAPLGQGGGFLTLGHGSGGAPPFSYALKNQDTEVGFLKIFLSTSPIDLSKIPQTTPFITTRFPKLWSKKIEDTWDTLLIPVILRRKPVHEISRRSDSHTE